MVFSGLPVTESPVSHLITPPSCFIFSATQLITCCLSFTHAVFPPSLLSHSLSPLLKWPGALRISIGVRKGQPYCPRGPAPAFTHAATCPSLLCVNAAGGVTVLAPHHLNPRTPNLLPVHHCPRAHTLERDEANTQTCGIPKRMGVQGTRLGARPPAVLQLSYGINQGVPLLPAHPFLTLPIAEDSFSASILHQQGFVWSGERPTSWGESEWRVRRSRREREAGSQKSFKDEKLAFQIDS